MLKDPWTPPLASAVIFLIIGWTVRQLRAKLVSIAKVRARKLLEPIEEYFQDNGVIEQTFMLSTTGFLTTWIAMHPNWTFWKFITQSPESPKNAMLGATSIIALLTFVTASMASAAKERADSRVYLRKSIATYAFSESLVSRLLSTPEFSIFTLIVFIVPFVINSITVRDIVQVGISPHLFAASLWSSCFSIVSITLIVTLLTLLRASMDRLLQPSDAERRIREALRYRSASEVQRHFSLLRGFFEDTGISVRYRIHYHLQEAKSLPNEQQKDYIRSAFNGWDLVASLSNRIKSINRALAIKHILPQQHALPWQVFRKIMRNYCLYSLSIVQSVMQSRSTEMIKELSSPELPISLRSTLTDTLMNEAVFLSTAVSRMHREEHDLLLESKLLLTEDKLPRPVSMSPQEFAASYSTEPNTTEHAKVFEVLTATTFQDLAHLIRKRVGLTDSDSSTEYVKRVITRADSISDAATRLYSLKEVIGATIYASVSNFTQGTRLSLRILNEIGEGLKKSASQFTDNAVEDSQNEIVPPNLKRIILDNVRNTFSSYPYMCAEVYSELLTMIPDSDVRPTFLHYLTFNAYQGIRLDLDILSSFDIRLTVPFYYSLSARIPADRYPRYFKRYLYSGMTGLNSKGVNWLFGILETEVDCRLYSKYLKLRHNNGLQTGFDTVLLWRIMAGDDFNPVPPVYVQDATPDIEDHQLARLREEVDRAAGVLDSLGKNTEADKLRYSFGVPTPEDIGRSDA